MLGSSDISNYEVVLTASNDFLEYEGDYNPAHVQEGFCQTSGSVGRCGGAFMFLCTA